VSRAFRLGRCGDCRVPAGISGSLVRDQRGMLSCLDSKRRGYARDTILEAVGRARRVIAWTASGDRPRGERRDSIPGFTPQQIEIR
jgi:hypothetical protein